MKAVGITAAAAILALCGAVFAARRSHVPMARITVAGPASSGAGATVRAAADPAGKTAGAAAAGGTQAAGRPAGAADVPKPTRVAADAQGTGTSWEAKDLTLDEIKTRIAGADIAETDRLSLMDAFRKARGDPAVLQSVLDKLKMAVAAQAKTK